MATIKEYVHVPNASIVLSHHLFVGTKKHLYLFQLDRTDTTTRSSETFTFTINGRPPHEVIEEKLADG